MNKPTEYPAANQANFALAVLLVAYILSFVDRTIMAVLVGPIREDLNISDFQFSILHGWAFTLFYIILGIPIGRFADSVNRKWIITGGVFLWSIMTCMCGFAKSFFSLFVTRIGVGVGEAALSPPAYSLLSDYFHPQRLRWATAIFAMGITIGAGLSFRIGGWMYDRLTTIDLSSIPLLGQMKAWQLTFIVVGLPGIIVVLFLLFMKEPKRQLTVTNASQESIPFTEVLKYIETNWKVYGALMFGVSMMAIIGYGTLNWFFEFLVRTYGMSKTEAGGASGDMLLIAGTAGTFAGAWFATLLQRLGYIDANMRMVMLAASVLTIPAVVAPLMPTSSGAILISWFVIFIHYTHFGVAMAALQLITPNRMRAQVTAIMLFMSNLFGLALGGSFVAFFTDFIFTDDQALRYSLACVAGIVYPLAAIVVGLGLKHYRAALASQKA
jgi:MFS family permease